MSTRTLILFASILLCSASPGAAVDFFFAPAYPTGLAPQVAELADMDGDGDLDVVTVDLQYQEAGTVSVSLNNGAGGFAAPASYPVGTGSAWLAVGDLNQDGRPDVVVSNSQAEDNAAVTVYINSGSGTLISPHTLTAPAATYPLGIAIGDWNGDGQADVAVALMMTGQVKFFWGNGTGNFPTSTAVNLPGIFEPNDLAAAQFDGDANLDLVVTDVDGARILYGTGSGFTVGPYLDNFGLGGCDHVVIGDFNNDGHPDFATTGQTLTLFLNDGTGNGWIRHFFAVGEGPVGIAAGDFDGDGNLDVAAAVYLGNAVSVYYGDGAGSFPVRQDWGVGSGPKDVAIGDLNGDSRPDVVAPSGDNSSVDFQVVLNLGGRTFHARRDYDVIGNAEGFAVADFDRDGNRDVLVAVSQPNDNLKLIRGNGDGTMAEPVLVEAFGNNSPTNVIAADFNEDGWMDAAASILAPGNDLRVWLNDGAGTLLPSVAYTARGQPSSLAAGDLNGDAHLDVIVVNSAQTENSISVFIGVGDGTFLPQVVLPTRFRPIDVALADFDRDGDLDVLITHLGSNFILLFVNDGVGGLVSVAIDLGVVQRTPSVADFDADGWPDVALNTATGAVNTGVASVLFNNHLGGFTLQQGTANASGEVGLADFDRDGDMDIVATNHFGGLASVLLNDGAGQFAVDAVVPVGYEASHCSGADFNGDGWPEIVTANLRAGSISIVTNVTNATLAVIFSDGFESGDTSAWSIALP